MQDGGCLARSTISFGRESGCQLTGLERETRTIPPSGGVSWAQVHRDHSLHLGNASSSCTSGKKGTGAGRGCEPRPAPRNQSSSREGSGLGGLLTSSPMLTAVRAALGPVRRWRQHPRGAAPPHLHFPSPDAAIDILSTDGAPN